MKTLGYNRKDALEYAHKWAFGRNPKYLDFSKLGGDCTNFISQCIYAGCKTMNHKPIYGWYYYNSYNRTASWTGVQYLYDFLIKNKAAGPFATEVPISQIQAGDIIQLSFDGTIFRHSLFVVETGKTPNTQNIKISTHTYDRDNYPISNYIYKKYRCLHIEGYRI
jgi:hypothetical protein